MSKQIDKKKQKFSLIEAILTAYEEVTFLTRICVVLLVIGIFIGFLIVPLLYGSAHLPDINKLKEQININTLTIANLKGLDSSLVNQYYLKS